MPLLVVVAVVNVEIANTSFGLRHCVEVDQILSLKPETEG